MGVKPWQIGLFVVAAAVLAGGIWFTATRGSKVNLADHLYLIDVSSGQVFRVAVKTGIMTPAKNPDTGKVSLICTYKDSDGKWKVTQREMLSLRSLDPGVQVKAINPKTGEVLVKVGKIRTLDRRTQQ